MKHYLHHRCALLFFIFSLLLFPSVTLAKKDLEDEIQDFTVAERAFQDKFYDFARQELERFLEYYPRSVKFGQAKLLLGRTYLELGKPQRALEQFSEIQSDEKLEALQDQTLYWSAETHLRGKDFKIAGALYQRLIDDHPHSSLIPYAVYSIAWCQEAQMKFDEAESSYEEFATRFPDHTLIEDAAVRSMVCLLRQKKFDQSLKACSAFLEEHPDSSWRSEIFYLEGEVFFNQEHFSEAIVRYEKALKEGGEKPWRPMALLNQGWSYFKIQDLDRALSLFTALTDAKDLGDGALFGVALCYRYQGKNGEALSTLEKLFKRSTQRMWRNKAMLEKGKIHYALSQYPEAAKSYQELLMSSPTGFEASEAHYGLGWVLQREGKAEEAIAEFEWVSQRAPEVALRVQALCRMGDIHQDRREFQKALAHYERVLKEYPFAVEADYAAYQIAVSNFNAGTFKEAVRAYEDFLSKFQKSIYRFQAQYDLGMAYYQLGRFDIAQSHFEQVKGAHPTEELSLLSSFQIGNCLYNLKAYEKAVTLFKETAAKAPPPLAAMARYEIGWCLYQMGKREEAVQSFQDYLSIYPDSEIAPDILFWFAEYYERQKEYDRSEKYFEMILKKFPESPLADEALFRWSGLAMERRAYDKTMKLIEQLVSHYPNSPLIGEALLRKSELSFLVGKKEEGRKILHQILDQFPNSHFEKRAARKMGDLLKEEGRYPEAIAFLEKAKTGDAYEPNAQIQFEMGECYEALGNGEKALEEFLRLSYLYPKSTYWVMRSYLKIGALFEKQGKWEEAVQTYEKLTEWHRLEEAEIARRRLEWIKRQAFTTQRTQ